MKKAVKILAILFLFQLNSYAQRLVKEECVGTDRDEQIVQIHENDDQTTNVIFKRIITDTITFSYKESIHLIKLNSDKEIILTKKMDSINENGHLTGSIVFDNNGDFLLTYYYYDTSLAVLQMEVNKYDDNGNFSWKNNISNNFFSENPKIKRTNTSGYVFIPSNINSDFNQIICINHLGQLIWGKTISMNELLPNPSFPGYTLDVFPLKNENTFITYSVSSRNFFGGVDSIVLVNTLINNSGNEIKSDTIGSKTLYFGVTPLDYQDVNFYFSFILKYDTTTSVVWVERTMYNGIDLSVIRNDSISNVSEVYTTINHTQTISDTSNLFTLPISANDSLVYCKNLQNQLLWSYPYKTEQLSYGEYLITDNYSILIEKSYISNGIKQWESNVDLSDTLFYKNKYWKSNSKSIEKYENDYYYMNQYVDTICGFCSELDIKILFVMQLIDMNTGLVKEKMIIESNDIYPKYVRYYDNKKAIIVSNTTNICHFGLSDIHLAYYENDFNTIKGIAYIDYNNNNIKQNNEPIYPYGTVTTTSISDTQAQHLSAVFPFFFFTDSGSYVTKLNLYNNYYSSIPLQFTNNHNDFGNTDTLLFALHPIAGKNDVSVNLVNNWMTRLGQENDYTISIENKGTTYGNGKVKVVMDSRLLNISASPNYTYRNGDTLVWNIVNQLPTQKLYSTIHFTAETPSILDAGDTLTSKAWFESDSIDLTPIDNSAEVKEIIRASYDPNEKNITNGETLTQAQINDGAYISYIIHFENKGNDTAFKVIVIDTLSEKVDIKSLEIINSSHPYKLEILGGKILKFTFENIRLSYDSLSTSSKGYIAYKIKARTDIAVGNIIDNTANIFFDYNQPIRTNTAQTKILVATATQQNKSNDGKLTIYPNPNNGIFTISFENKTSSNIQLELLDISGNIIYSESKQHQIKTQFSINQNNLAKGVYWIKLSDKINLYTATILVQ